jgi:hypothetical protein
VAASPELVDVLYRCYPPADEPRNPEFQATVAD